MSIFKREFWVGLWRDQMWKELNLYKQDTNIDMSPCHHLEEIYFSNMGVLDEFVHFISRTCLILNLSPVVFSPLHHLFLWGLWGGLCRPAFRSSGCWSSAVPSIEARHGENCETRMELPHGRIGNPFNDMGVEPKIGGFYPQNGWWK